MSGLLLAINEIADVEARFAKRFDVHGELNPVILQARLQELRRRIEAIKPKLDRIQNAREDLTESLLSLGSISNLAEKLPDLKEQFMGAERALESARRVSKASGPSKTGKEAARRTVKVDREVRLASAMNLSSSGDSSRQITITEEMLDILPSDVRDSATLDELQSAINLLVRCGGKLPYSSMNEAVVNSLLTLDIIAKSRNGSEVQFSRKYGVLLV